MQLAIKHATSYDYSPAAQGIALRLRLFPASNSLQSVRAWSLKINGVPVKPFLTNAYGDAEGLWFSRTPLERIEVIAEGVVETINDSGVTGRFGRAPAGVFLRETKLTAADEAIEELSSLLNTGDALGSLHELNQQVHKQITYRPGTTDANTTASQALAQGAGVCQDLAHVFIAAARSAGIPARYVVGYLHDAVAPVAETHGWAEAHIKGLGWVGFDPTHQISPTTGHVRLCAGLDAKDAAPLRGSVTGCEEENLSVTVAIAEAEAQQQ